MNERVYLDWNATAPLRPEAREAMIAAMEVVGNPSSVHSEGRAATGLVERARRQVSALVGCEPSQIVFTGSATEAAALAVRQKGRHGGLFAALPTEHDCLAVWSEEDLPALHGADGGLDQAGVRVFSGRIARFAAQEGQGDRGPVALVAMSAANSETGIVLRNREVVPQGWLPDGAAGMRPYSVVCDITQLAGKAPIAHWEEMRPAYMILSAHKLGGPKGVGALVTLTSDDPQALIRGGGQEMGRRSGTENVIGIAGFGAAAEAAARDLEAGSWDRVAKLRNILERTIEARIPDTIFIGRDVDRLPNTSCFIAPGWRGETQVMAMDLAGFAISAGSACSSGKVRASRVLQAMGYSEDQAACAIRVSLGPTTTEEDVLRFARTWIAGYQKHQAKAA